jgi:hypothetical protein
MDEVLPEIGPGAEIVTEAAADLLVSATLVAVTVKLPAVLPAIYKPVADIVPPIALQVTAVFEEPVTIAENCCDAPSRRGADVGETLTLTAGGGGFFCDVPPGPAVPVQPESAENKNIKARNRAA